MKVPVYTVFHEGEMPLKQEMGVLHMTEAALTRVKKIQMLLFAVVVIMLFFGGCGEQGAGSGVGLEDMEVSLSGGVDISTMGTEAWQESQAVSRAEDVEDADGAGNPDAAGSRDGTADASIPEMTLNPDEAVVTWQGIDYLSSCRAIGGDSIYTTGFEGNVSDEGLYFAGRIGIEEDEMQQFSLDIPKDMFVYRSCTDAQGRWHLLLSQRNGNTAEPDKKTEVWVINRNGELEQSFDITEYIGPWFGIWMAVDHDGIYYLAAQDGIRVIDVAEHSVAPLDFGGEITGIGIGRSGALYGMFRVEEDNFLGVIDTDNGSVKKCASLDETLNSSFSILQGGVDMELFLANKGNGVWSYDGAELKQELAFADIMENGQDILAIGFLWDGRMCVMSSEGGKYVFRYIPMESVQRFSKAAKYAA
ncbi:MAG: hypothetical protein NC305_13540 [Lachnospiraceae bacterium]|nr:hypothetical protein [Butyrivibrio sp.]MCM1343147.1 hypothetical protein [Muribaculaceae bacterium]MCM1411555.1 hypothetical protein [Lachnospiraceae bacterium]